MHSVGENYAYILGIIYNSRTEYDPRVVTLLGLGSSVPKSLEGLGPGKTAHMGANASLIDFLPIQV